VWNTFFEALINSTSDSASVARTAIESYFEKNPAKAAGMRTAFIDRRKRPFGDWPYQPDLMVEDFKSLADTLA
jgi:FMN phosphatase YigB (HAD superfamily)